MSLLKTKLRILVESGIPGNNTLISADEAEYILNSLGNTAHVRESSQYLDSFIDCESVKYEHCPDCDAKYVASDIVDFSEATKALEALDLALNKH